MPTSWTAGDVSGGTALTSDDHLYNTHINEIRTAVNGAEGSVTSQAGSIVTNSASIGTLQTNFPYQVVGGILRAGTSGTWTALTTGGHTPFNMGTNLLQGVNTIEVPFGITFSQIITASVTPDETMVTSDYACGASVDFTKLTISIAHAGTLVNPNVVTSESANMWIYVIGYV